MSPAARAVSLAGAAVLCVLLAGCAETAKLPTSAGIGPSPALPPPNPTLIPTVHVAEARPWPPGAAPTAAPGLAVNAFATGLAHPRWLLVLPNGDVLVAESNAPPKPEGKGGGLRDWIASLIKKKAGAGVPSADRISVLRDADGDGVAELQQVLVDGLYSPFGMALVGERLYVANADGIVFFPFAAGQTRITAAPTPLTDLPGGINHHWTKNILASPDGRTLYATVGSNSNVGERGLAAEEGRAAIWAVDLATGDKRLFATGLRNPNGLAFEPTTGVLWTVVNERDEIGSDLVPDYLTAVHDGAFYGWPWSYFGAHVDERVQPPRPDRVAQAVVPDYALGTHVAALGLSNAQGQALGENYAQGMFIGLHGSWNRRPRSGYKVVFVPFERGRPAGMPREVLGGFVNAQGEAHGRPVGVAIDRRGALLVADDVGNAVWRVSAVPPDGR